MNGSSVKKCPLCIANGFMKTIVVEDDEVYVCKRVDTSSGQPVVMENEYMLAPKQHIEGNPPVWLYARMGMLEKLGVKLDNLYVNLTSEGGRLLDHAHIHVINRVDSFGLGLNGMIVLATEQQREIEVLKTENTRLRRARVREPLGKVGTRLAGS